MTPGSRGCRRGRMFMLSEAAEMLDDIPVAETTLLRLHLEGELVTSGVDLHER